MNRRPRNLAPSSIAAAAAGAALMLVAPFAVSSARAAEGSALHATVSGSVGDVGFRRDGLRLAGGLVVGTAVGWASPASTDPARPSMEHGLGWGGAWLGYELVNDGALLVSVSTVLGHGGSCTWDDAAFDGCRTIEAFLVAEQSANVEVAIATGVRLSLMGGWRFVSEAPDALRTPAGAFGTVTAASESRRLLEGPVATLALEVTTL